jgi:aryl-alcohol dehydrogenase-like predicted oxidoreductase
MKQRILGKTGVKVSEIALGCWQLGAVWGEPFDMDVALDTLKTAASHDIDCFDTADVYNGGASEASIGRHMQTTGHKPFVITKMGRRLSPHNADGYNETNFRRFIDDSRKHLGVEALDLTLLHCPPPEVYDDPEVFHTLDRLKEEGLIKDYGVSVETVDEAMKALRYPGVAAIEIIFNMFRMKPAEVFFDEAKKKGVGVIVRVPLASGLLTGKFDSKTTFGKNDHRTFNRNGEAFDKGETFSGVDYDTGLKAAEELKAIFPDEPLAEVALRWILMFDAVSTVIPGASKPHHIAANAKASMRKPLTEQEMEAVRDVYDRFIKDQVHHLW